MTKSAVGDPVIGHHTLGGQQPVAGGANNSLSGAAYGQPMDLAAILQQKPASAAPGGPTAATLSQYNQAATQDLKSAIGIGGAAPGSTIKQPAVGDLSSGYGSSALSYSSGKARSLILARHFPRQADQTYVNK